MSILDRLVSRLGYSKAAGENHPDWLLATAGAEKFNIPEGELYQNQAELYQRLSWVNIAVGIVARTIASEELQIMRRVGEELEEVNNHPLEIRLDHPNPLQSRFEFLESTYSYRALTGNAYWYLNRPNENAEPDELWIIPSYKIRPVPDEKMYLKGYLYDPGDGQEMPLETWQICHFKSFHPLNQFVGLSPIEALAVIATGDMEMQKWNTRLFGENNANLPGIIGFADPIPNSEWDKLKKDMDKASQERAHMMLRNVGKGGIEWLQTAVSQKEMEFLAGRKMNKEEIFGIYAPGLASMLDVNATEANARSGKATYLEFCVWPILEAAASKITSNLLPAYGENLVAQYKDVRMADRAMELKEQQVYSRVHTIDEIRKEKYGEDKIGTGVGHLLPAQIAAEQTGGEEEQPTTDQPPEGFGELEGELFGEDVQITEEEDIEGELKSWEKFAINRLGKKSERSFESDIIPAAMFGAIEGALEIAQTKEEIEEIFAVPLWGGYP